MLKEKYKDYFIKNVKEIKEKIINDLVKKIKVIKLNPFKP